MSKRSYRQYCALARALDVVGDRWAMLIIRNLLLGPQKWGELRDGLPGIAKNLLASRLSDLQEAGVVVHEGQMYRLTPRGQDLQASLFALAGWGERHVMGPPASDEALRLRYLVTSMRRRLERSPERLGAGRNSEPAVLELTIDEASFTVTLGDIPTVVQGPVTGHTDASVQSGLRGIQMLLFGDKRAAELANSEAISLEGDALVIDRFVAAFRA